MNMNASANKLLNVNPISVANFLSVVKYNVQHNIKKPILALGESGIGKSKGLQALAEELFADTYDGEYTEEQLKAEKIGKGWVDVRLLMMTETEVKGIPVINTERDATVWLTNNLFPILRRNGSQGILILDELPEAARVVQTVLYQLCTDYKMGTYVLMSGWYIVALGNREDDGGDYNSIPYPLLDRFTVLQVECEYDSWKRDYAYPNNIHELCLSYLNSCEDNLHTYDGDGGPMVFATPRSWVDVSDIIHTVPEGVPIPDEVWYIIEGTIGDTLTAELRRFYELSGDITKVDDILSGAEYKKPSTMDEVYLVLGSLVTKLYKEFNSLRSVADMSEDLKLKMTRAFNFIVSLPTIDTNFTGLSARGFRDFKLVNPKVCTEFFRTIYDTEELNEFLDKNGDIL